MEFKTVYDDIIPVHANPLLFDMDAKIFQDCDDEGFPVGEPYSYNDGLQILKNMSGVNVELLGPA